MTRPRISFTASTPSNNSANFKFRALWDCDALKIWFDRNHDTDCSFESTLISIGNISIDTCLEVVDCDCEDGLTSFTVCTYSRS